MLKIGLTGGIGSGKSTAAELFAERGATLIDSDKIARELVEPGTPALLQITTRFGNQILQNDGRLNRNKLGEIIFANNDDKTWLEDLLHPLIRERQKALGMAASGHYLVLEIPLLVENQLQESVDRVLVVDVDEQTQIARTSKRDNRDHSEIAAILDSQASREDRLRVADDVINNDGDIDELIAQVNHLHEKYLAIKST